MMVKLTHNSPEFIQRDESLALIYLLQPELKTTPDSELKPIFD